MPARRLLVIAILGCLTGVGCNRPYARKMPPRPVTHLPDQPAPTSADLQVPISTPVPPQPPADPPVNPPKSDVLAGTIPALPGSGSNRPNDLPESVALTAAEVSPEEGGVRERIEQRRRERELKKEKEKDLPPTKPTDPPPLATPTLPRAAADPARDLVEASKKRFAEVPDYEARFVKREVVNGKPLPQDEILYRVRQQPLSVYMKVLSDAGQDREVLYVRNHFGNKMHVLTGKGDNALTGVGFKTTLDPDSATVTAKSRYRIYEAGFSRTLNGLSKALDLGTVKLIGTVSRKDYDGPLDGLELTLRSGDDRNLPRGGTRRVYFDAKADSVGYRLPVLVITLDSEGKEVEYYCFDRLKIPSGWTDADWTPDRLKKK